MTLEGGRIALPNDAVKRFGEPNTREDIPVWLLLIDPGHVRVISDQFLQSILTGDFKTIDAMMLATKEERERLAALRMRLFSTAIKPVKRLPIPTEVFEACDEQKDRQHVWIDYAAGFLDIYTVSYREKMLLQSPARLLTKADKSDEST